MFDQFEYDQYVQRGNELQIKQNYTEKNKCEGCPLKEQCTQAKYKTITKDVIQEEMHKK